jgi:hypothetical protein
MPHAELIAALCYQTVRAVACSALPSTAALLLCPTHWCCELLNVAGTAQRIGNAYVCQYRVSFTAGLNVFFCCAHLQPRSPLILLAAAVVEESVAQAALVASGLSAAVCVQF